ncbi:hypothetical protein CB0940_08062 [Cercospora beticola]|uniref:NmrA-like domain-containing protein n=2 Tax=Cercospora beticola TaxID=122368 RepID=A0A2G5HNJ8_CERBT|nr:hypothetical protein CB0940_08062 [Cercospora beticola]PIA94114.1 hypothetical protein CB0940_08062 [Cercospora beticola]
MHNSLHNPSAHRLDIREYNALVVYNSGAERFQCSHQFHHSAHPATSTTANLQHSKSRISHMAYQNIAIAGATGSLGPSITRALIDAGFNVTALSLSGKTDSLPTQIKTVKVDCSSHEALVKILTGHDALISLIPTPWEQPALVDAAIAAGVKFFIPSEFGADITGNAHAAALPLAKGKPETLDYLRSHRDQISYVSIVTGLFFDWALQNSFLASLEGGLTRVFDGGDLPVATTTYADIAKTIVAALENPEAFKNRPVYLRSATVTQNQLLAIAQKKKPGVQFEREDVRTADIERDASERLAKGDMSAMLGFVAAAVFNPIYGSTKSAEDDNKLVGIKEMTPEQVEAFVERFM